MTTENRPFALVLALAPAEIGKKATIVVPSQRINMTECLDGGVFSLCLTIWKRPVPV
jgi:hypothetical protein